MKIVINYDLINEITKANTGIDFKRVMEKTLLYTGVMTAVNIPSLIVGRETNLASYIPIAIIVYGGTEFVIRDTNRHDADFRLNNLASSLKKINIYTDAESIKQAKLYKTQFRVEHDDGVALQQNKYIMLPTTGSFNADRVSLLQEHIIGSREYALSIGEPKKVFKKDMNSVFAR